MDMPPAPVKDVLWRLPRLLLPAGALAGMTYAVPALNPAEATPLDLTGPLALAAYWVAESGGVFGIPVLGAVMIALLISRPGVSRKQRTREALVVALVLGAVLGGGAYLNEHLVKPAFKVPRPNILELAERPPDAPALGMSAEAFYALPDKARSDHLEGVLTPGAGLHERVRAHWIAETGYSFPSGHSFSAMTFATFFLAMGLSYFAKGRLWVFHLLVLWAVAVCFSRPILRVHSPTDVCVGALQGIVAGILAFLLARGALALLRPEQRGEQ
jgi:phosphatidylglycerophosphatase B